MFANFFRGNSTQQGQDKPLEQPAPDPTHDSPLEESSAPIQPEAYCQNVIIERALYLQKGSISDLVGDALHSGQISKKELFSAISYILYEEDELEIETEALRALSHLINDEELSEEVEAILDDVCGVEDEDELSLSEVREIIEIYLSSEKRAEQFPKFIATHPNLWNHDALIEVVGQIEEVPAGIKTDCMLALLRSTASESYDALNGLELLLIITDTEQTFEKSLEQLDTGNYRILRVCALSATRLGDGAIHRIFDKFHSDERVSYDHILTCAGYLGSSAEAVKFVLTFLDENTQELKKSGTSHIPFDAWDHEMHRRAKLQYQALKCLTQISKVTNPPTSDYRTSRHALKSCLTNIDESLAHPSGLAEEFAPPAPEARSILARRAMQLALTGYEVIEQYIQKIYIYDDIEKYLTGLIPDIIASDPDIDSLASLQQISNNISPYITYRSLAKASDHLQARLMLMKQNRTFDLSEDDTSEVQHRDIMVVASHEQASIYSEYVALYIDPALAEKMQRRIEHWMLSSFTEKENLRELFLLNPHLLNAIYYENERVRDLVIDSLTNDISLDATRSALSYLIDNHSDSDELCKYVIENLCDPEEQRSLSLLPYTLRLFSSGHIPEKFRNQVTVLLRPFLRIEQIHPATRRNLYDTYRDLDPALSTLTFESLSAPESHNESVEDI